MSVKTGVFLKMTKPAFSKSRLNYVSPIAPFPFLGMGSFWAYNILRTVTAIARFFKVVVGMVFLKRNKSHVLSSYFYKLQRGDLMIYKFLRFIRLLNYKMNDETKSKILENLKMAYDEFARRQQDDSHDDLIFLTQTKRKTQRKHRVKKVMISFSGLAALFLVFILAFSSSSPDKALKSNRQSGQSQPMLRQNIMKEQTFSTPSNAVHSITTLEQSFSQSVPSDTIVKLGLGIDAHYFAGSDYFKYQWEEGRWTLLLAGRGDSTKGTQVAKNVVAYLHTHSLPAPEQKGVITLLLPDSSKTTTVTQNTISRQVGETVYTLKQTSDPIRSLQTVINSSSNTMPTNNLIKKQTFTTSSKAINAITSIEQNFTQTYPAGTSVNLGSGISSSFSQGDGHYKFVWYEGRWTFIFIGWGDPSQGTQAAKKMVAYLNTHYLPAPDQKGLITVLQPQSSQTPAVTQNSISRQVGNKVYTLKQTGSPIKALQTVVNSN